MRNNSLRTLTAILVLSLFMTLSIANLQNSIAIDNITTTQSDTEPRTFQLLEYTFEQGFADFEEYFDDWKVIIQTENPDIIMASEASHWDPSDGSFQADIKEMNTWFPDERPYQGVASVPTSQTDGQAIVSRFPIISFNIVDLFTLDDGSVFDITHKIVDAVVDIDGMETHLITTHFTCCGQGRAKRIVEQEALMNYMDDLGDVPIIYAADFNSDSPEDIGELRPLYSTLTGNSVDIIINNTNPKASTVHNFTDMFRTLNPYDRGFTFVGDIYRSRIDYIFVNQWLVDYMSRSYNIDSYPEATRFGHRPLAGIFNLDYAITDLRPPTTVDRILVDVDIPNVQATLSWSANTDQDLFKYQIYRNFTSYRCLVTEIPKTETSFVDNYLYELDNLYVYEMTTVDEVGNVSPMSNSVFAESSKSQIIRPSEPVLTATGVSGGIQLNWTIPDDGGADDIVYLLRRASDLEADPVVIAITNETSYFNSIPGAPAGTPIYYWVTAVNYVDSSYYSNIALGIIPLNENLNSYSSDQVAIQSIEVENNDISLHQDFVCPDPINLLALPTPITSEPSSTTPIETTTTSSITTPVETSEEDESPLSVGIVSLFVVNIMIATIVRGKKN